MTERHRVWLAFLLVACCSPFGFAAVEVAECRDRDGRIEYHMRCPPGTTQENTKRLGSQVRDEDANSRIRVTLYVIPDCASCVEVKEFLDYRKVAYDEKFVHEDIKLQTELKELSGKLSAPTVVIGESLLTGYNRDSLMNALREVGYVEPTPAEPTTRATPEPDTAEE